MRINRAKGMKGNPQRIRAARQIGADAATPAKGISKRDDPNSR